MHNLRRFYYQNKEKVWKVALIIALIIGLIYFLNKNAMENNNQNTLASGNSNAIYEDELNKTYISDTSAVSGATVTEKDVKKINNTISKFLQYCKNENYEEAYNMISSDCKEKLYPTLEEFISYYIKTKFNKNHIYEIEEWIGNTYRVSISEDMLATGDIGNSKKIVEYMTIVEEDSKEKLNINSYIGKKEINKEVTQNNVKITVINKEIYLDYEIYNFKVENLSNKTVKLDALEKTDTIYLEDRNGYEYSAYSYEIFEDDLIILPDRTFEVSIKFSNAYKTNRTIKKIVFSNMILNYDENKIEQENPNISKFVINL